MNCLQIDERLLTLTAVAPVPSFSDDESEHLRLCPGCRERLRMTTSALAGIARASGEPLPDPSYWPSILPRVRERSETSGASPARYFRPAVVRMFAPAAAVAVLAILLSVVTDRPPVTVGGGDLLAVLSDDDLYELRQSGRDAALLEPADANGGVEPSVSEFIADLLPEETEQAFAAFVDPEELLRHLDEEQFTEIASLLDIK